MNFILKQKNILISVLSFIFVIGLFGIFSSNDVSADCLVTSTSFRPDPNSINQDTFYDRNDPPYVYVDVVTNGGCSNTSTLDINIKESSNNVTTVSGPAPNEISTQFTIAYISGENGCSYSLVGDDCSFYISINDDNGTQTQGGNLYYDCETGVGYLCQSEDPSLWWVYKGIIGFEEEHEDDTAGIIPINPIQYDGNTEYEYLAPLPGFNDGPAELGNLIKSFFDIMIIITGILAMVMLVVGAITYMSADAISGKSSGKDMMLNAILGLILALGAWVILTTISPQFTRDLSINIPGVNLGNYAFDEDGNVVGPITPPDQTLNCPTCEPISSSVPLKPNLHDNKVSLSLKNKLDSLYNATQTEGLDWRVTEAWHPTPGINHFAQCHYTGECIDANFFSAPTPAQVEQFIQLAQSNNLKAVYEVESLTLKQTILDATSLSNNQVLNLGAHITAPHFSVYN